MARELRVGLEGPDAVLGKVPAGDVANLILGIERAIARAAAILIGRSARGRRGLAPERAARLRLLALETGSIVPVLELPDVFADEGTLELADVEELPELATRQMLRSARAETGAYGSVTAALAELMKDLEIGDRYQTLWLQFGHEDSERVVVDRERREQLQLIAEREPLPSEEGTVVGTLVEADFEKNSARLRTPNGKKVDVTFDSQMADKIQTALRRPAELVGEVAYDPKTSTAVSIVLRRLRADEQLILGLDTQEFWGRYSVEELQHEQGIAPVLDMETLKDREASEDEVNTFLAMLGLETR